MGPWGFVPGVDIGVMGGICLVAVGFLLMSALASSSMSRGGASPAFAPGSAAIAGRWAFAVRWWEAFRLVLLMAIGPALIALALATGAPPIRVVTKVTPLPGGGTVKIQTYYGGNTFVTTTDASGGFTMREATAAEIAAAEPAPPIHTRGGLLGFAALAVVTILAHGAAFISLGASLGIWIRRRWLAIAAGVGLVLFVTVGWPILYLFVGYPVYPWGLTLASVLPAYSGLVFLMNRPTAIEDIAGWAGYWDMIMILSAVIISGLAIRTLDRRSRGPSSAEAETEDDLLQPAIGEPGSASIWG